MVSQAPKPPRATPGARRRQARPSLPGGIANIEQAEAWDGEEGVQWIKNEARYDAFFDRLSNRLLEAAHLQPDAHVLDIGCGCGQSTRRAAGRAARGTVLGVDLSERMLAHARTRSRTEGLSNVQFAQGDAQVYPFAQHAPRAYDVAISQFGAMFFADPVAAFGNIGRAVRPGGRVVLLAWQAPEHNAWLSALRDALAVGRSVPPPRVGAPGPFGLADPVAVRRLLTEAGLEAIQFEAVEEPVYLGADLRAAVAFARALPVTQRLLDGLGTDDTARALDRLQATLAAHATGEGVLLGAAAWLIMAHTPAATPAVSIHDAAPAQRSRLDQAPAP